MGDAMRRSALHAGRFRFSPKAPMSTSANPEFLGRVGIPRTRLPYHAREGHTRDRTCARPIGRPCVRNECRRLRESNPRGMSRESLGHPLRADRSMPSCCTFVGVVRTGRRGSERTAVTAAIRFDVRLPPPDSGVVPFSGSSLAPTGQGGPAGVRTPWLSISRRLDSVSNQPLRVTDGTPTAMPTGLAVTLRPTVPEPPARANGRYRAGRVVVSDHSLTD